MTSVIQLSNEARRRMEDYDERHGSKDGVPPPPIPNATFDEPGTLDEARLVIERVA